MSQKNESKPNQVIKATASKNRGYKIISFAMIILVALVIFLGISTKKQEKQVIKIGQPNIIQHAPTVSASIRRQNRDPLKFLVGIVAGHKGYDSGAVCDDGLTEAEINYAIASEVVSLLERRGIQADLLNEYDDYLTDYQANALVSIHADSCNVAGASGFKVARVTESAIPEAEDLLVSCLNQEYAAYTGLPLHSDSITDNMTSYHAFNEIAPLTPGAIIETGFLLDDRFILEYKPKITARGIAAGIICFLEQAHGF